MTSFDLAVNIAAYLPLGCLTVLALYPQRHGAGAIALATLAGALLSGSIEALQTYLPTRISSNVDLLTNTLGALTGAAFTAPFCAALIDRGRLLEWRRRWFERDATAVVMALALWPAAQIYPEPMLFGNGDLRDTLEPFVTALGGRWLQFNAESFGPAEYVLAEAFVIAAATLADGTRPVLDPARRCAPLSIAGRADSGGARHEVDRERGAVRTGPCSVVADARRLRRPRDRSAVTRGRHRRLSSLAGRGAHGSP